MNRREILLVSLALGALPGTLRPQPVQKMFRIGALTATPNRDLPHEEPCHRGRPDVLYG